MTVASIRSFRFAICAVLVAGCAEGVPTPVPAPVAGNASPLTGAPPAPARAATPTKHPQANTKRPQAKRPARKPVDSVSLEQKLIQKQAHAPLAKALARRSGNTAVAERVAAAVVREAQRRRVSPSLVAGVLLVENAPMDTTARSRAGALGLMQVMPFHAGGWGCDSAELRELDANVCHGVGVLQMYLQRNPSVTTALRRYNGCTGCRRYPARVLRTASSIRREMLTQAASRPGGKAASKPGAATPTKSGTPTYAIRIARTERRSTSGF